MFRSVSVKEGLEFDAGGRVQSNSNEGGHSENTNAGGSTSWGNDPWATAEPAPSTNHWGTSEPPASSNGWNSNVESSAQIGSWIQGGEDISVDTQK